jgi:peptidoglycan/LPS O-acetylase OafA/YrhL
VLGVFVLGAWLAVRYGVEAKLGYPEAQNMVDNQWWGWLYQVNNLEAFRGDIAFPGLPHLWSLAIEEQFYLVWPLLVLKAPRDWLFRICIGVALASMVFRCVTYPILGRDFAYHFTLARFDGLAIGAAGAVIVATPALRERFAPAVAWIGRHWWVAFVLVLMPEQAALYIGFTVLSVGYLGFILAARDSALTPRPTRWLHSRLLLELGTYSYAIYVFSLPISRIVIKVNPTKVQLVDATLHVLVTAALSYALARLSWTLWESRWLRLKHRFAYA